MHAGKPLLWPSRERPDGRRDHPHSMRGTGMIRAFDSAPPPGRRPMAMTLLQGNDPAESMWPARPAVPPRYRNQRVVRSETIHVTGNKAVMSFAGA